MELEWSMASPMRLSMTSGASGNSKCSQVKLKCRLVRPTPQVLKLFVEAIGFDPDNRDACNELARLYWMRLKAAQERNDDDEVRHYRELAEAYNRGLFTSSKREARLTIRTDPPGPWLWPADLSRSIIR